jgi:hypothetical protein
MQMVRFMGVRFSSGALVSSGLWALVCRYSVYLLYWYSIYLLYWCNSTNTDVEGATAASSRSQAYTLTYADVC